MFKYNNFLRFSNIAASRKLRDTTITKEQRTQLTIFSLSIVLHIYCDLIVCGKQNNKCCYKSRYYLKRSAVVGNLPDSNSFIQRNATILQCICVSYLLSQFPFTVQDFCHTCTKRHLLWKYGGRIRIHSEICLS